MSSKDREDLATFLSASVLPGTNRTYEVHWRQWTAFLEAHARIYDPLLKGISESDKTALVSMFIFKRYQSGLRDKGATAVTAGIRLHFARALESTTFLDAAVLKTARQACQLSPAELRSKLDRGRPSTVKLPFCEDMLTHMKTRMWNGQPWSGAGMLKRMTYLACMWGFDQSARVSEYTTPEPRASDHCVRVDDLTFCLQVGESVKNESGSTVARGFSAMVDGSVMVQRVIECRVLTASSKGKRVTKPKLISRRSPAESNFLDELIFFMARSGAAGDDELFSMRDSKGKKTALTGRRVRMAIKETCYLLGLPPKYFSAHSLRKGGITQMRTLGATEEDRRDRGGYSAKSTVMNDTYDYAVGLGPLAAKSLKGGYQNSTTDVTRLIPAKRGRGELSA